jgi:hypothetical protein
MMTESELQQRSFILSSLRRSKIEISTFAYRFADKMIKENWAPHLGKLEEVDSEVENKYHGFISGHF